MQLALIRCAPAVLVLALVLVSCEREQRSFREVPAASSALGGMTMTPLQPGPAKFVSRSEGPYEENAYAIAEGQRLYTAMNCNGCHAQGGGGIGPPLMDDRWIYGSEPANVFSTIVEGRPNGMPAFLGRLTSHQVWQLVAYVRSMSGLTRKDARPGRTDHMQVKTPEVMKKPEKPKQSFTPPKSVFP